MTERYVCTTCGTDRTVREMWTEWNDVEKTGSIKELVTYKSCGELKCKIEKVVA